MAAQGSQLTNKYAEGYPGRRYYGGCEYVDLAEQLALDRVKRLFGADTHGWAANVQPHSGAQANEAVFMAFMKPGDTFMGMNLAEGGHLSHGMALNMSGKWFNAVGYGLNARRGNRLRRDGAQGAREPAENHHRRRLGLCAAHRLRALRADRQGRRRAADGRHGALRRADRRRRVPEPDPARRHRHQHHAQEPARAARRHHPDAPGTREGDQQRGLPRAAGRPADARDRRQGGGVQGGAGARVQELPAAGREERRGAGRDAGRARPAHRQRPHREPPDAGRPARQRA